jgi:phage terminase large subunit-like protein
MRISQTDGARTDHRRIEEDIREASKMFKVRCRAFDQRESNDLISNIQSWASFECIEVPQSPAYFNEPMKEMEAAIYAGTLRHCGDPAFNDGECD